MGRLGGDSVRLAAVRAWAQDYLAGHSPSLLAQCPNLGHSVMAPVVEDPEPQPVGGDWLAAFDRAWASGAMAMGAQISGAPVAAPPKTSVGHVRDGCDVYIGRPSKWGNPFIIGKHGDRQTVIDLYREYLLGTPELLGALGELRGKRLGCHCWPQACHGQVLVELVENHPAPAPEPPAPKRQPARSQRSPFVERCVHGTLAIGCSVCTGTADPLSDDERQELQGYTPIVRDADPWSSYEPDRGVRSIQDVADRVGYLGRLRGATIPLKVDEHLTLEIGEDLAFLEGIEAQTLGL